MKQVIKLLLWIIGSLFVFIGGYVFAGHLFPYFKVAPSALQGNANSDKRETIWVKRGGVHVDLILPLENEMFDWKEVFSQKAIKGGSSKRGFIVLGWGSK